MTRLGEEVAATYEGDEDGGGATARRRRAGGSRAARRGDARKRRSRWGGSRICKRWGCRGGGDAVGSAVGAAARGERGREGGATGSGCGRYGEDCVSRFSIHRQSPTYLPAPSLLPPSLPSIPPPQAMAISADDLSISWTYFQNPDDDLEMHDSKRAFA